MTKTILLAGAAMAFALTPAYAEHLDLNVSASLDNSIDTSLATDVSFDSNVSLDGDVDVSGDIDVDAAAVAVSDSKQITTGEMVIFDERVDDGTPTEAELEAFLTNDADAGDVDADGNVGVNAAAGYFNTQANISTIAVASGGDDDDVNGDDDTGGMAQASTTGHQDLTATYYGPENDDPGGQDPFEDTNTATTGSIDGDGNIGVNSAAGAFNQQQNIMTLAVASDSALASASAGVMQYNAGNVVILNDSVNTADAGSVSGAGNIHVNVAAGVGNQQHNSLTVAASGAFGGNGTGGTGGGGAGGGI